MIALKQAPYSNFSTMRTNEQRYDPVTNDHALVSRDGEDANANNTHIIAVVRQFIM